MTARGGEGREPRALAVGQTVPARGDVAANVAEHLALADVAVEAGARALVFPELSLTGYELDLARELAFDVDDLRLDPLRAAARDRGVLLVVGAPARVGERYFLGAFVLRPDGAVDLYTKQHLGAFPPDVAPDGAVPPPEATVFEPGDRDPPVDLGGHAAAVAVCADTGRPAHPEAAARRGATTYLASMFFTPPELDGEHARLAGHARRHALVVAMANFGGPTGGLDAAGASAIWSDRGELLVRLDGAGAGVAVALEHAAGWRARAVPWPA